MRLSITILFTGLFAAAFTLFFAMHSVLTYVTTPAGVVDTARSADTRELALDVVERLVRERLEGKHPVVQEAVVARTRQTIEDTVTSEWFYGALESAYPDFIRFVETGDDTPAIELGEIRAQLRTDLMAVAADIERDCAGALGSTACGEPRAVAAFLGDYRRAVDRAIDQIPERTSMRQLLRDGGVRAMSDGPGELRDLRGHLETARLVRWLALGVLVVLFALIVAINMRSLGQALTATGAALVAGGALHLAVVAVASDMIRSQVERRVTQHSGEIHQGLADTGKKLAVELAERSLGHHNDLVVLLLVAGACALAGGLVLRRLRP